MRRSRQLLYQKETLKYEMLNTPINRLGLKLKGSFFEPAIAAVREEMRNAGITKLEPIFYVSTGYGCIAGSAIISLGFYDFHPLLKELNYELRGWHYSDAELVALLRHEVGHAFCYSYKLYRTPEFRAMFNVEGNFFNTYPAEDDYDFNPWSKRHVNPSGDYYAQKHPDEDFAETFTVWLTPRSGWRKKYARRKTVLQKLKYTQNIVAEWGNQSPPVQTDPSWMYERVEDIKQTVATFMHADAAKLKAYEEATTGYVDPDLQSLYRAEPRWLNRRSLHKEYLRADIFMREQKLSLINRVSYWVGVDAIVVRDLIEKLIHRARALDLWLERAGHEKKLVELTSYVTALCMNYKYTGGYLR
jgi:hypothetical protein